MLAPIMPKESLMSRNDVAISIYASMFSEQKTDFELFIFKQIIYNWGKPSIKVVFTISPQTELRSSMHMPKVAKITLNCSNFNTNIIVSQNKYFHVTVKNTKTLLR